MSLGIASLASGSTGNCYLIVSDETRILLDVGISAKRIKSHLSEKGLSFDDIDAVLITHEHSDHVKSLKTVMKNAKKAKIYASHGTLKGIYHSYSDIGVMLSLDGYDLGKNESERVSEVTAGESLKIGDIEVAPFRISHDTPEPVGYSFFKRENGRIKCISVITDTGYVTREAFDTIKKSDVLLIESNHEPDILMYGRYPYHVKQRILSNYGHLSNEACATCLIDILRYKEDSFCNTFRCEGSANADGSISKGQAHRDIRRGEKLPYIRVYLAHLSQENNTPEQAMLTVSNILEEEGYYVGKHLSLEPLRKNEATRMLWT